MISIVINADTRPQKDEQTGLFSGTSNEDFLTDGIANKIKYFEGFDKEVILFVDEHQSISETTMQTIKSMVDTLVVRKHTGEPGFNDKNYVNALQMARGEYIAHFDQDCAAFTSTPEIIQAHMNLLEAYDYVSYPSHWSPLPVDDKTFNYQWVSTRYFICKRETLNFPEIVKCLTDYKYFCETYEPSRVCPWTEHILGLIAKKNGAQVYYPQVETDHYAIFCWNNYETYTLRRLNLSSYEDVKGFIQSNGGIHYPCDLTIKNY